jgi:hypothetical protein
MRVLDFIVLFIEKALPATPLAPPVLEAELWYFHAEVFWVDEAKTRGNNLVSSGLAAGMLPPMMERLSSRMHHMSAVGVLSVRRRSADGSRLEVGGLAGQVGVGQEDVEGVESDDADDADAGRC